MSPDPNTPRDARPADGVASAGGPGSPARPVLPADQSMAHESLAHPGGGDGLEQPNDRDERVGPTATQAAGPDPQMRQAARDLAAGQVDTDLRNTPGLDAERRGDLVEGGEHGATRPPGSA